MLKRPLFAHLASLVQARLNCALAGAANNLEWYERHGDRAHRLTTDKLPSGSGFDSGSMIELDRSKPDRLVFATSFHHMNDAGMYDGWTEHDVIATPSLQSGFDLRITGRDRNTIKDHIYECFDVALRAEFSCCACGGTHETTADCRCGSARG